LFVNFVSYIEDRNKLLNWKWFSKYVWRYNIYDRL